MLLNRALRRFLHSQRHDHVPGDEPDVVATACDNARQLTKICDILDQLPEVQHVEVPDGAFILPPE